MRKILIILGILLLSISTIEATCTRYSENYFNGDGQPHYPNSGYIYAKLSCYNAGNDFQDCDYIGQADCQYDTQGHNVNYTCVAHAKITNLGASPFGSIHIGYSWALHYSNNVLYLGSEGTASNTVHDNNTNVNIYASFNSGSKRRAITGYEIIYVNGDINIIHGTMSCVNNVTLYGYINSSYQKISYTEGSNYAFDIFDGMQYKLVFSNGHEYEFTCDGSDVEYDYSACTYIYGYTCNINWVKLWRNDAGSWTCIKTESQPYYGVNIYLMQIESGYNYKLNFSDGHEYEFTCDGSDIEYDWDRCIWVFPPSPWQPPEIIPWYLGYDNNIVFMRDSHGNFIENAQIAVYNKKTGNYTQKWTNTPDPYILLAANNDSNDDVIVMCRTFDGIFTLETVDPAFGTDENVTWTNWTIPIMYNLEIHPTDQSNMPLHDVFVSMYEYAPFDPLAFFGYDTYWGYIPVTSCSGFSRCDIVAEKEGYQDYSITGLNWTTKSALVKDYKQDIVLVREES